MTYSTMSTSLVLVAVGAILAFAVNYQLSGIDLNAVGGILIIVGLVGFLLSLLSFGSFGPFYRERDTYVEPHGHADTHTHAGTHSHSETGGEVETEVRRTIRH